jgi:hypothetical protein
VSAGTDNPADLGVEVPLRVEQEPRHNPDTNLTDVDDAVTGIGCPISRDT